MDALAEALNTVRMTGAIFFSLECGAPWGFAVPPVREAAHLLSPDTERLVNYHLVTEGTADVRMADGAELTLAAGDVLILPHGHAHTVSRGRPATLVDSGAALGRSLSGAPAAVRIGGNGETTRIVCGFFGCERHAERTFLAGLPPAVRIGIRGDAAGDWLEGTIRYLVSEAASARPGRTALLSKLAEALFIEALRRYMEDLPPEQDGWLAGARDPVVGRALALLHRRPFHAWSLADLAAEAGASRSVLAERFARFLGETPLGYLARWRLQLAARLLQTTAKSVLQVAAEVGYESDAAFSRAFKREFGLPPGQYRRHHASADAAAGG